MNCVGAVCLLVCLLAYLFVCILQTVKLRSQKDSQISASSVPNDSHPRELVLRIAWIIPLLQIVGLRVERDCGNTHTYIHTHTLLVI